jgi:hypothetical protein
VRGSVRLSAVALVTGLLPILAIHLTYLLAASFGHVPWCFPYVDSCTSISATGRQAPEYYVFKALMIPAAMLLMLFWYLTSRWLESLGLNSREGRAIALVGFIGAVFLILYTTMLGAQGDLFRLQRRIGVIVYFTFTALAELLLLRCVLRLPHRVASGIHRVQFALILAVLAIGILSLILGQTMTDYETVEDAIEWNMALLIHLFLLTLWVCWRNTGFTADFGIR